MLSDSINSNHIEDDSCCPVLRGKYAVAIELTLVFAIYFLFSLFVPYSGDDYAFVIDYMNANDGSKVFSLHGWKNVIEFLRITDNSRLCNIIFVALRLSSPKWLLALVVASAITAMSFFAARVINYNRGWLSMTLVIWVVWVGFLFPWRGNAMAVDNSFNLFLSSAFTLAYLILLRKTLLGASGTCLFVISCIVAFIGGWIHEGYSIPICCGMGVLAIKRRFKFPVKGWIMAIIYVCTALYAATAPGLWTRFGFEPSYTGSVNIKVLVSMTVPLISVMVMLFFSVFCYRIRKQIAESWRNPVGIIVLSAMIVSLLITIKTGLSNPRALWIVDLFASLWLFMVMMPLFLEINRRWLCGIVLAGAVLFIAFNLNLLRVQREIGENEKAILREMENSTTGTVFRPYSLAMSKMTLFCPVNAIWLNTIQIDSYNKLHKADGKTYAVVPPELIDLTGEMVDYINSGYDEDRNMGFPIKIAGNAGLYYYKGVLLEKDQDLVNTTWNVSSGKYVNAMQCFYDYECEDGRRFDAMGSVKIRFCTRDGRKLIYIAPGHYKVTGPYKSVSLSE